MNTGRSLVAEVAADVLAAERTETAEGELPPVWSTMVDLDWPGIAVDEGSGGSGGSLVDLAKLLSTTAGHGVSAPLLEASVARWVLARSGVEPDAQLAVCTTDDRLVHVPWARYASRLVVFPDDGGAFLLDLHGPGITIERGLNLAGEPRDTVHVTAGATRTALPDAPARSAVAARAALLNAAALTGAARGAVARTREHASGREQFGRPLLALKAVAQGIALMDTELVSTESALERALDADSRDAVGVPESVAAAKVVAAKAATEIARYAHQLHGAIGVTREHSLHHLTRKLWAWRDEYGSQRSWAITLGRRALDAGEDGVWDRLAAPA